MQIADVSASPSYICKSFLVMLSLVLQTIRQCDVKHIMTSPIKKITSALDMDIHYHYYHGSSYLTHRDTTDYVCLDLLVTYIDTLEYIFILCFRIELWNCSDGVLYFHTFNNSITYLTDFYHFRKKMKLISKEIWKRDGLHTLSYRILSKTIHQLFTRIVVDINMTAIRKVKCYNYLNVRSDQESN